MNLLLGEAGEGRLKQILNYEYWNCQQDPKTKITGYILFVNSEEIYEVSFREFINGNEVTNENHTSAHSAIPTITKTNNQSQYRFILPRSSLQELNQRYQ
ncbi:hypothetical protein GLOIN_2v1766938 [Rhizophagus irregularis DAOM 181602=DAOM 197198]|uniref:Uncharacterized protein n=1 Tax=Rhizophagus irregularis (strain DAOM 181602 / DAOM 197198 / MUCL 43194) TaxID=747089 RepID=A0A2P4QKK7_RHIID|nr:hypothetical protein GLOIN_2v1766938 [Rhizophagus irregularis DAOM 181602=DAOM 197198]POG78177.1 hypothetical protein GLOIN_2v1766938 [Rhizophagus irregularis DAOM 181602=DAOM 197198]|eukprot:XP_025185043.1 hypothetical protein GLOIN_2v1766938 [Rhizophagus irregularis DAOM 181602=DAOM 197198]